jgi:hypothetical protein
MKKYYKLSKTSPYWDSLSKDLCEFACLYDPLIIRADEANITIERWEELPAVEVLVYVLGKKVPVFKFTQSNGWQEMKDI